MEAFNTSTVAGASWRLKYIAVVFIRKAILAICKRFMFIVTEDSYLTKNLDEVKSAVIG